MSRKWAVALVWLFLAIPAIFMLRNFKNGTSLPMDLLHPTGEMAVRLMILAMLPGPLMGVFGNTAFLRKWLGIRRYFGLSAFAYAVLHTCFYLMDMFSISAIWEEMAIASIGMGWLALLLILPPAAISSDRAMRYLGAKKWKLLQRLVYLGLIASLIHWLLLDWHWQPALIHLAPLIGVWTWLGMKKFRSPLRT